MSKRKFVLGALFSTVAGIVDGVLTAPKSGKETRADLKKKANELKNEAGEKAEKVKAKGEKVYSDVRNKANAAVEEGRKTVDDYSDRAVRAANAAKDEFNRPSKRK